jgi:hypothetical protein
MLTLKAILRTEKIYFSDGHPPGGKLKILVTILDEEAGHVVISQNQSSWLRV